MMESLLGEERRKLSSQTVAATAVPVSKVSLTELSNRNNAEVRLLPGFNRACSVDCSSRAERRPTMIDNSNLTYLPMHLTCGVTVYCRPDVLTRCPQILRDLDLDVKQCLSMLPRSIHRLIRRTNIWVNTTYYYGSTTKPINVNHSTAHHHQAWLISVNDRVEKAPGIEIYNCFDYRRMRWHWNGCGLLLHEFCHLIHQFCLGLDDSRIEDAYEVAKKSGRFDTTLRRDWAGLEGGDTDMAYALVNPKEFFAELSVAYWSQGYDDGTSSLIPSGDASAININEVSPPFTAPEVIARLDPLKYPIADESLFLKSSPWWGKRLCLPPHCNKFYPFTRGQFTKLDPELFDIFCDLWEEIANWKDDGTDKPRCWPC